MNVFIFELIYLIQSANQICWHHRQRHLMNRVWFALVANWLNRILLEYLLWKIWSPVPMPNLLVQGEIALICVSFTLEVEFEFTTWAWVQATAETTFGGGLVVRSPGSVKALNQSTHNSLGTRSGSHFLFFWKHQNLCLDLNIFGFTLQEGATKIVSTVN